MENLTDAIDTEEFQTILKQIVYKPTPEKFNRVLDKYRKDPNQMAFGFREGQRITGMIGLNFIEKDAVEMTHIVVVPENRGQGIGRKLIEAVFKNFHLKKLIAETDQDAVGFYRCCGFGVKSLGEKYPGTERFECILVRG